MSPDEYVETRRTAARPRFSSIAFIALLAFFYGQWLIAQPSAAYSFEDAQTVLKSYCQTCHQGKNPPGRLDLTQYTTAESLVKEPQTWGRVYQRMHEGSMPPKGAPAPNVEQRAQFSGWLEGALRTSVCDAGVVPGPAPIRRLNRNQYSNTIRHLLNIPFHAGHALPEDGAGGEGFDNAAETLFLSPMHAEKYLEAAKEELDIAFKNPKTREAILIARPGPELSPEQAARKALAGFLPRAFRRPVGSEEVESYTGLFRAGQKRGGTFEQSMMFALEGVLISPQFLFRVEEPNPDPQPRLVGDYELASRLS